MERRAQRPGTSRSGTRAGGLPTGGRRSSRPGAASERRAGRRRSPAGARSGRRRGARERRSVAERRSNLRGLAFPFLPLLLFLTRALEVAAGLRQEDIVERRLVDLQLRQDDALGIECTHDLREVAVRGRQLHGDAAGPVAGRLLTEALED